MALKSQIIILLLSLPCALNAQWVELDTPALTGSMNVINSDTLVFCQYIAEGKIYSSFDGGTSWSEFQTYADDIYINDFDFVSNQTGYGCGGKFIDDISISVIIKTEDAGLTWDTTSTFFDPSTPAICVDFLSADTGFVITEQSLYRTFNGGQIFNLIAEGEFMEAEINNIYLTPDNTLFLTGKKEPSPDLYITSMYKSIDLGETWNLVYLDSLVDPDNYTDRWIRDICFPTAQIGYAGGGVGTFLKTTDAGLNWNLIETPAISTIFSIDFINTEVGYINGYGGALYKTIDGGENWGLEVVGFPVHIDDIQFANSEIGYVKEYYGIHKTTSGTLTSLISNSKTDLEISLFPNPSSNTVNFKYSDEISITDIQLLDITGRAIKTYPSSIQSIDISALPSGNYLLRMTTNKGLVVRKLVIE